MKTPLWDQRLAAILVRPLIGTGVTPNHVTTLSLAVALIGAGLIATGDPVAANWGAGLFMAGVVPGMMIGFGLMIYCYFFGPTGMRKPRAPLRSQPY